MKKYIIIFLFILFSCISVAQKSIGITAFSNQTSKLIFVGVSNQITLVLPKNNFEYFVFSNEVNIQKTDSFESFVITTKKIGNIKIFIANIIEVDTQIIDSIVFESIIHKPIAEYLFDSININEVYKNSLPLFSISFRPWIECKTSLSYALFHIRGDSLIIGFYSNLTSAILKEEILDHIILDFQKGDDIIIMNFTVTLWGTHEVEMPSKRFKII
jgi:hypothetical protein